VTILNIVWRSQRAYVRSLFYWYLLCDPRRCEINWKVRAPRRVNVSGVPHIVTWTKQTWIKHQCTTLAQSLCLACTLGTVANGWDGVPGSNLAGGDQLGPGGLVCCLCTGGDTGLVQISSSWALCPLLDFIQRILVQYRQSCFFTFFKGAVSWKLSWVLLYINRKLGISRIKS